MADQQTSPIKAIIFDFFGVMRVAGSTGAVINRPLLDLAADLKKTYKIAVLSNTGSTRLSDFLPPENMALFDAVITPEQSPQYVKPAPEAYLAVAEKLEVEPEACVMIDDLAALCQGARAVGMQAIEYISFAQLKRDLDVLLSRG
jgi:HAD superfamily hydrolase (TIGR01509 family)